METILKAIDKEIALLEQAKKLLSTEPKPAKIHLVTKPRKHKMSPEGRARIAAAAKLRWKKVKANAKELAKQAA